MAAKTCGYLGKVLAVIFSSIVAPVLVDVAVQDIHGGRDKPADVRPTPSEATPPEEVACVVARGVGRTPDEALRDALHVALRQALAARIDAGTWARRGQALCEDISRDSDGLILGWKEIESRKEWRLTGARHHEQVVVSLNCRALADRLHAVRALDWSCPSR